MSHSALEADNFPSTISIPDVDDTTYPATVGGGMEDLADRTRHIQNSLTWNFGAADAATFDSETEDLLTSLAHPYTRLGSLNFWSQIAKPLVGTVKYLSNRILGLSNTPKKTFLSISPLNHGDVDWVLGYVGGYLVLTQLDISGSAEAHFDIPVPLGGYLRNVTVWAVPLTGITHVSLPANKPTITVYRLESQVSGLSSSAIGTTVTDPSASTGAYDVLHVISADVSSAMQQTPSSGAILGYRLKVTGESGANSIAQGFAIAAITATFGRGGG